MNSIAYRGTRKTIVWARDQSGRLRGKEYFDALPPKDRAKVEALFERMGDIGTIVNETKFRKEEGAIFCFKSFQRRLLCFFNGSQVVVTHGFTKKTDKMPRIELDRALRIRQEHLESKR